MLYYYYFFDNVLMCFIMLVFHDIQKIHDTSNRVTVFCTAFSFCIYTTLYFLTDVVQQRLYLWLLKTQNFLSEVASPLVKTGQSGKPDSGNDFDNPDMEDIFMAEQTIHSRTPNGILSSAAIVSIEQFSR